MEQLTIRPGGFRWRLMGAALAPFAIASAYLFFTRWPSHHFTASSDYAGLAASVLVGAAFIATLPLRRQWRVLSLLVYLPVVAVLLFYFTFWFIALVFHDAL